MNGHQQWAIWRDPELLTGAYSPIARTVRSQCSALQSLPDNLRTLVLTKRGRANENPQRCVLRHTFSLTCSRRESTSGVVQGEDIFEIPQDPQLKCTMQSFPACSGFS
jgi:hypothetical protein